MFTATVPPMVVCAGRGASKGKNCCRRAESFPQRRQRDPALNRDGKIGVVMLDDAIHSGQFHGDAGFTRHIADADHRAAAPRAYRGFRFRADKQDRRHLLRRCGRANQRRRFTIDGMGR